MVEPSGANTADADMVADVFDQAALLKSLEYVSTLVLGVGYSC
jgi:hypothetical protein